MLVCIFVGHFFKEFQSTWDSPGKQGKYTFKQSNTIVGIPNLYQENEPNWQSNIRTFVGDGCCAYVYITFTS